MKFGKEQKPLWREAEPWIRSAILKSQLLILLPKTVRRCLLGRRGEGVHRGLAEEV